MAGPLPQCFIAWEFKIAIASGVIATGAGRELAQPQDTGKPPAGSGRSQRRATSYDVARLAGVSQSAVSRVFKPGASASADMRRRVMDAAAQVGYRPNAIARGLITRRSNMVGVIISKLVNLNYPEVLVELTQRFSSRGIRVLLFALETEGDTAAALDQVLQYRVDGVVTAAMLTGEQLRTFDSAGIPVVFYNRAPGEPSVNAVRCDHAEGERWLAGELVAAGHRRFSIISGPEDSPVSTERTLGAIDKLRELGIDDVAVVTGDYGYLSGREGFAGIVEQLGGPPDAVIAANDMMAIGCIDEARSVHGLDVPADVSVVGFDGVGPAAYAAYRLTTVSQPVARMAEAAVSMLLERIEDSELPPEKRVFSGIPIRGGSARLADSR